MTSVVLAGGGTAGHTSPLLATAERLLQLAPDTRLICIGTEKGLEGRVIPAAGLPLELIEPVPLPRSLTKELFSVPMRLARAVRSAGEILRAANADVVVGFGGYVSLPAYLAAKRAGIPVILHEQNAHPGLANKIAARFATRVAVSFPDTPLRNAEFIGLPLRAAITNLDRRARRYSASESFGLPMGTTLLVSGGSQGARSLNNATLAARDRLLAKGVSILHVMGANNLTAECTRVVDSATGACYVPVGFVSDMGQAYAAADLMFGRSGAGTVMETATVGLPTIFVPLPHGNGEQGRNVQFLLDAAAGLLIADADLCGDLLYQQVTSLLENPTQLAQMERRMRDLVPPDAAQSLAQMILNVGGAACL